MQKLIYSKKYFSLRTNTKFESHCPSITTSIIFSPRIWLARTDSGDRVIVQFKRVLFGSTSTGVKKRGRVECNNTSRD